MGGLEGTDLVMRAGHIKMRLATISMGQWMGMVWRLMIDEKVRSKQERGTLIEAGNFWTVEAETVTARDVVSSSLLEDARSERCRMPRMGPLMTPCKSAQAWPRSIWLT